MAVWRKAHSHAVAYYPPEPPFGLRAAGGAELAQGAAQGKSRKRPESREEGTRSSTERYPRKAAAMPRHQTSGEHARGAALEIQKTARGPLGQNARQRHASSVKTAQMPLGGSGPRAREAQLCKIGTRAGGRAG